MLASAYLIFLKFDLILPVLLPWDAPSGPAPNLYNFGSPCQIGSELSENLTNDVTTTTDEVVNLLREAHVS